MAERIKTISSWTSQTKRCSRFILRDQQPVKERLLWIGEETHLKRKRFRGTDPIETVANDILKRTKKNWNGVELYKTMPVTIDFSKRLSGMGKQLEELGNKA